MTKKEKRQPVQSTRCMETVDIEELLEWMAINPESYPDNDLLHRPEEKEETND